MGLKWRPISCSTMTHPCASGTHKSAPDATVGFHVAHRHCDRMQRRRNSSGRSSMHSRKLQTQADWLRKGAPSVRAVTSAT
jgi:hypothetical protein